MSTSLQVAAAQKRAKLLDIQDGVRQLLEQRYVKTPLASVLVVLPEVSSHRQPWIEIRMVHSAPDQAELEMHIESSWPDVDFEFCWTDEEGL